MKILHTSDWHLGKNLDGYSRLEEQKMFLADFVKISKEKSPNLILISGDIYDNPNPPAIAESLFYETIKKSSNNGKTMIVIIPGNHDNAMRLASAKTLAKESCVIIIENYDDIIPTGDYGKNKVISSDEGVIKVEINNEKAVIITLPFISEQDLGKSITDIDNSEEINSKSYQNKLANLIKNREKMYEDDTINLMMAHLFTVKSSPSGEERTNRLGSAYLIDSNIFPKKADYIALGHIHKMQVVEGTSRKCYYSGSPIHYNKTEAKTNTKYILEIDIDKDKNTKITEIPINIYKKIEIWKVDTYQDALKMSLEKADENSWVYIEIEDSRILTPDEISEIKNNKKDVIDIRTGKIQSDDNDIEDISEKSESEKFSLFYEEEIGDKIPDDILEKYMYFLNKVEEDGEY